MFRIAVFFSLIQLLSSSFLRSAPVQQGNGSIEGSVKDTVTGEPLISANVFLKGTSLGSSTDFNGKFVIRNVPPGSYAIRASYVGYESAEGTVEVKEGTTARKDFSLQPVGIQGQEVVVTAQASGQNQAINEQLAAPQIMNVVSSARIRELPDANAAESVGRLPGISILRVGGEGTQIVVRGLQPKYNAVMIDGIRIASSNPSDRSADLSMISSYSLESIEVTKAVTADQDADVLGGIVNFRLREAREEQEGPVFSLIAQGGYNGLSNAPYKYNNYRYIGSVEGRFFDDRSFGTFLQVDLERRNLTSNEFGASYFHLGDSFTEYITQGLNLNDVPRDRQRANGTIGFDYKLPEGKISLMNFLSSGTTDVQNRQEFFDIQNNLHNYSLAYSKSTLNAVTNILDFQHQLSMFIVKAKLAHTYSETKNPNDWTIGFQQASAGLGQFLNVVNLNPHDIPVVANNDTNSTYLSSLVTNSSFSRERVLTAALDLETNVNVSDMVSSTIKFGGKYRYQTRSYVHDQSGGQGLGLTSARYLDSLIASHFPSTAQYNNTTSIPIKPFMDPNFSYGKFLNGDFPMVLPLNFGMLSEMANFVKNNADLIAQNDAIAYFHDNFGSTTNNYFGNENQSAFYIMATISIGSDLTIIPGIRYQDLGTTYTAARGIQNTSSLLGGSYLHYDTTLSADHSYWLPDVILRYKPLPWFDARLAYTNTLAYPDFIAMVPRIDVSIGGTIAWNNYQVTPTRSTNYDAYFSFYDNSIGLFTVGGFLKQIDNLIYPWTFNVSGAQALPYFPPNLGASSPNTVYSITTFVNNPYRVDNWGLEFDWQTHFWYLPHPLDGLVLNVNYTHIFSRAQYPYTEVQKIGRQIVFVDTSFIDRLLDQPNNIVNLSIGYDYGGFSIRGSLLYQADIWSGPDFWPQTRSSTAASSRWDVSVKQDLPWFGLQVYSDVTNLNGALDTHNIQAPTGVPSSQQSYGLIADFGVRWKL